MLAVMDARTTFLPLELSTRDSTASDTDFLQASTELYGAALTEERLRVITGFEELNDVTEAELTVDSTATSISVLGESLPALTDLRLSSSKVPVMRDFGTRLTRLKRLWLNHSYVADLHGIGFMHQLCEVYLAFNRIADLSPLASLLNLEVLDLEGNLVSSIEAVEELGGLCDLRSVTLAGNPIAHQPAYRSLVVEALPNALELLDDEPTTCASSATAAVVQEGAVQAELHVVASAIRESKASEGAAGLVEEQHRGLLSRQSSSSAGVRRAATASRGHDGSSKHGAGTRAEPDSVLEDRSPPRGNGRGVASAPPQLGKPQQQQQPQRARAPLAAAAQPMLKVAPHNIAAGSLATNANVFTGNITRSLRRKGSGGLAVLGTDDGATTPSDPPSALSQAFDDVVDETPDGQRRQQLLEEVDELVLRSLEEEERRLAAAEDESEDATAGDDNIATARARAVEEAAEHDARPEVQAWRARLEAHLQGKPSPPLESVTDTEMVHAVAAHKRDSGRELRTDIMRDVAGVNPEHDGFEPVQWQDDDGAL